MENNPSNNQNIIPSTSKLASIRHRHKWTFEQTVKYYEFVQLNQEVLQYELKKDKQKIFNKMSEHVGSRTTHQCRSHHQKVLNRYNTIDQFVEIFSKQLEQKKNLQVFKGRIIHKHTNQHQNNRKTPLELEGFSYRSRKQKQRQIEHNLNLASNVFVNKIAQNNLKRIQRKYQRQAYKKIQIQRQRYIKSVEQNLYQTGKYPNLTYQSNYTQKPHFYPYLPYPYPNYLDYNNQYYPPIKSPFFYNLSNFIFPQIQQFDNNHNKIISYAQPICQSIIQKQNHPTIQHLINKEKIKINEKNIRFTIQDGQQDDGYYKMWIQGVKDQENVESYPEIDEREMERERIIEMILNEEEQKIKKFNANKQVQKQHIIRNKKIQTQIFSNNQLLTKKQLEQPIYSKHQQKKNQNFPINAATSINKGQQKKQSFDLYASSQLTGKPIQYKKFVQKLNQNNNSKNNHNPPVVPSFFIPSKITLDNNNKQNLNSKQLQDNHQKRSKKHNNNKILSFSLNYDMQNDEITFNHNNEMNKNKLQQKIDNNNAIKQNYKINSHYNVDCNQKIFTQQISKQPLIKKQQNAINNTHPNCWNQMVQLNKKDQKTGDGFNDYNNKLKQQQKQQKGYKNNNKNNNNIRIN